MQSNDLLDKIEEDTAAVRENKVSFAAGLCFVKNRKVFDLVRVEQIGFLKSKQSIEAQQCSTDGKGISEAVVGLEAQLVVTTKNAVGQQCYNNDDCVKLEVTN